jgi:tetratricopeptide (TPR) repeat protein
MVFDVQNEISFARVTHRVEGLRFPAGSVLEAVPAGSIAHILALDSQIDFGMSGLAPAEELPQTVRTIVEQKHVPFVAVFSILNLSGVTKRRGQIFVNEALTKLYQAIREIFGAGVKIGQTQPAEVAVITESSDVDENISLVKATLKIAHERCKGQITFKAGLFDSSALVKQKGAGDQSKIDVGRALDLARYAASEEAGEGDAGIVSFTPNVATGIVAASRMKGAYSKALEDYKRFTEYGIRIANLENQAALAQFSSNEQGSGDAAIASINRAIELKPSEAAFHANLGFLEFYRGNWAASCASYVKAYEVNKKFEMVPVYYYSYAMGRAHVAQQRPNDVQFLNDTKAALEQALQQTDVGKANQTNLQSMLNQVNSLILAA